MIKPVRAQPGVVTITLKPASAALFISSRAALYPALTLPSILSSHGNGTYILSQLKPASLIISSSFCDGSPAAYPHGLFKSFHFTLLPNHLN
jgi:hypothetical protein